METFILLQILRILQQGQSFTFLEVVYYARCLVQLQLKPFSYPLGFLAHYAPSFTVLHLNVDPSGEELESLIKCLKQGGVSLIGKQQVFTREQYRKSFVKRNKNPEINEKVHLIRTLQSTLKASGT